MTPDQAYLAMYSFLADHYRRSETEEMGALLGSMSLLPDGKPADPAIAEDWAEAVRRATSDGVDAMLDPKR